MPTQATESNLRRVCAGEPAGSSRRIVSPNAYTSGRIQGIISSKRHTTFRPISPLAQPLLRVLHDRGARALVGHLREILACGLGSDPDHATMVLQPQLEHKPSIIIGSPYDRRGHPAN